MKESYALITGSSSGIGLEIAYYLAEKGFNLILTARREGLLKDISKDISLKHKVKADFVSCDLSKKEAPKEIFEYCNSKLFC